METGQILQLILAGLGVCSTGFFILFGWVIKIQVELGQKISFKWHEEVFQKELNENLTKISNGIQDINDALIGTAKEQGLVTRTRDLEKDVQKLKDKVLI